jgi:RimJ/RimL family protein N-acetyltransferase
MDDNTNVPEVLGSQHELQPVRALRKLDPVNEDPEFINALWQHMRGVDEAFNDMTRENYELWFQYLFQPMSEHYVYGDEGYCMVFPIIPKLSASFHFIIWEQVEPRALLTVGHELFDHLFKSYDLLRIETEAASYSKWAIRMATLAGFRYEGERRNAILHHGKPYNKQIYGLLRDQFYKREVTH